MTTRELTRFALGGLWRQKVRTILTLIGVTVGTCALAFSLSLGFGLRAFIVNEFQSRDEFWRINVMVGDPPTEAKDAPRDKVEVRGNVSEERKKRLEEALVERFLASRPRKAPVPLTREKLEEIQALPDVLEVRTYRVADGLLSVEGGPKAARVEATLGALADLKPRLIAGQLPASDDAKEVVVTELALYDLGLGDDADLERAIGKQVRLEIGGVRNAQPLALARALTGRLPGEDITPAQRAVLEKLTDQLPKKLAAFDLTSAERLELKRLLDAKSDPDEERPWESGATATDTYRICGVVRIMTKEDRKKAGPLHSWQMTETDVFLRPRRAVNCSCGSRGRRTARFSARTFACGRGAAFRRPWTRSRAWATGRSPCRSGSRRRSAR